MPDSAPELAREALGPTWTAETAADRGLAAAYRERVSGSSGSTASVDGAQPPRLEVCGTLPPTDVAAVALLTEAATEADGVRPLSEHVTLHLRYGGEGPDLNLLLFARAEDARGMGAVSGDEQLVGYAHLDPTDLVAGAAAEVVVHPQHRHRGYGRMLVEAAAEHTRDGRLRLWAHGDHPAARALAASLGYQEVRQLWQLRRSLWSPLPPVELPDGVTLRAFRPGEDDAGWLALNARAFAGHPEQGAWADADLQARMREAWFDAAGFIVAEDHHEASEADGRAPLVAFHWTKVHGGTGDAHAHHDPSAHDHDHDAAAETAGHHDVAADVAGRHHDPPADDAGHERGHGHGRPAMGRRPAMATSRSARSTSSASTRATRVAASAAP